MAKLTHAELVEILAREFHRVYQQEAARQGDVRHADNYDNLPENIKEFDRVLARYILKREAQELELANNNFDAMEASYDTAIRERNHLQRRLRAAKTALKSITIVTLPQNVNAGSEAHHIAKDALISIEGNKQ